MYVHDILRAISEVNAFVRFRIATIQMKTQEVEYGMWWLITECYRWFSSKKLKSDFWSSFLEATAYKLSTAKMCRAEFKPWWLLCCYAEIQGTFLTTSITLNIYRTFYSVTWLSQCYSTWHLSNNVFRFLEPDSIVWYIWSNNLYVYFKYVSKNANVSWV